MDQRNDDWMLDSIVIIIIQYMDTHNKYASNLTTRA